MAIKITPDTSLATPEAVKLRIGQLEEELKKSPNADETARLGRRIKALQSRLAMGVEKTMGSAGLLKSKSDLQ